MAMRRSAIGEEASKSLALPPLRRKRTRPNPQFCHSWRLSTCPLQPNSLPWIYPLRAYRLDVRPVFFGRHLRKMGIPTWPVTAIRH
jgi:hypothetical protein